MSFSFAEIKAVVLDLDGVVWRGSEVLPQVREFFAWLEQHDIPFALATNNSTKTIEAYVRRVNEVGIPATGPEIITSAVATADHIAQHYAPGTPVYVVGQAGIREALTAKGFPLDGQNAQIVVVGMDFKVTYDKLRIAALRIRSGADFIGTNGDRTFPSPEGIVPGNGSLLAAIQAATDVEPILIGKPEPIMFDVALRHTGTAPAATLMVGDRLETDILGAQRAGLKTAVVLTGVTTRDDLRASEIQPDVVFETLADLFAAWREALD